MGQPLVGKAVYSNETHRTTSIHVIYAPAGRANVGRSSVLTEGGHASYLQPPGPPSDALGPLQTRHDTKAYSHFACAPELPSQCVGYGGFRGSPTDTLHEQYVSETHALFAQISIAFPLQRKSPGAAYPDDWRVSVHPPAGGNGAQVPVLAAPPSVEALPGKHLPL